MTAHDTLRHDCLTLRDLVEQGDRIAASLTYTLEPLTTLTYTRELGAVLAAGERTLAITEAWMDSACLLPCDRSMREVER